MSEGVCIISTTRAARLKRKVRQMSHQLIDENGTLITGKIKMIFVCDVCGNKADFYNGMTTYAKTVDQTITKESYCSEICARKAVANG